YLLHLHRRRGVPGIHRRQEAAGRGRVGGARAPVMSRQTKIVTTIGPATDDLDTLTAMVKAGADVARLNFSHGKPEDHARRVEMVGEAARRAGRYVGLLGDRGDRRSASSVSSTVG